VALAAPTPALEATVVAMPCPVPFAAPTPAVDAVAVEIEAPTACGVPSPVTAPRAVAIAMATAATVQDPKAEPAASDTAETDVGVRLVGLRKLMLLPKRAIKNLIANLQ